MTELEKYAKLFLKLHPAATLNKQERELWNEWHSQVYLLLDRLRDRAINKQAPALPEITALQYLFNVIPTVGD